MELTPLGDPIGLTPTNRKYADGKVYRVWREKGGKVRRRIFSHRNTTDKSAAWVLLTILPRWALALRLINRLMLSTRILVRSLSIIFHLFRHRRVRSKDFSYNQPHFSLSVRGF